MGRQTREQQRKGSLMRKMMKKAELDVDVPRIIYKENLNRKEILEKIRSACLWKIVEIDKELEESEVI